MPLQEWASKKVISKNIEELVKSKPSPSRAKAIKTYMKNHNVSHGEAKHKLAVAAALNKWRS